MQKLLNRLSELPALLAGFALFSMMLMTFIDVVGRSTFNTPLESATELTRILMAIIVFSVLPVVSGRGEHIVVDLADPLFSGRIARLRDAIVALACGAMLIWPAQRVAALAERARDYGDVTEYLNIPQYIIAWGIAGATWVTAIVLILRGLYIFAFGDPKE